VATQADVYAGLGAPGLDRELSWAEHELKERERTKHVHRLHPYLGKFVPQLVEVCLRRHLAPGTRVLDPFAGSGTTLVECAAFGAHSAGADISAFNALLARVKTGSYDQAELERTLVAAEAALDDGDPDGPASPYLEAWFAPEALADLRRYVSLIDPADPAADVQRVIASRAARSSRRAPHFNLDSPRRPVTEPYWCHKHRRTCSPTTDARKFLHRYTLDTLRRVAAFAEVRQDVDVEVHHGDARTLDYGRTFDGVITSPPYPGRIDYHGQHRYAFELLGLEDLTGEEIGNPSRGKSRQAVAAYCDDVAAVFANARAQLRPGAPVVIVIDDERHLFDAILERAGLELVEHRVRHVNRRTGRRDEGYFEAVLVARA
jgi:DNA modification methylase